MKALVWESKNHVRVVETEKPALIDEHDVIVKVTGSTICGSDVHLMHGVAVLVEKGDILGHEFCGVVVAVGPAVTHLSVGDRVVNSFVISCGTCRFCSRYLTTACEWTNASSGHKWLNGDRMAGISGYSRSTGRSAGGQAEFVRVPFGEHNLLRLSDKIPFEKGIYLSDALPTSYHSVCDTGVYEGDAVAVWGLGSVGLMACYFAFKKGAKRVIGIDNNWRTEYAKSRIPGLETIKYQELSGKRISTAIREMVPDGMDACILAHGGEYAKSWKHKFEMQLSLEQDTSERINECILSTRKFGRVGIIADYTGYTNHFNIGALMELGIRLIGCGQAPVQKYWQELHQMVESGEVDPTIMLTHRIGIDDIDKAYHVKEKRQDGMLKCFIETRFSEPRADGTPELKKL